jgi:hypothetical protein
MPVQRRTLKTVGVRPAFRLEPLKQEGELDDEQVGSQSSESTLSVSPASSTHSYGNCRALLPYNSAVQLLRKIHQPSSASEKLEILVNASQGG